MFIYTSSLIIKKKKRKKNEGVNLSKLLCSELPSHFERNKNNDEKEKKRDLKEIRKIKNSRLILLRSKELL